ncbi:GDSL esterase/lipase [Artemisia annua]|uniref:GDSL esterase/lipase n=1 Tax=Artemisia annua TaxID=35608 RepID=A0A2U1QN69_ARTAN|nr:GDSL esterase/lipase [Artemisia annua]
MTFVSILLFFCLSLAIRAQSSAPSGPITKNSPRAFFVFGDSLVDNGNNNFLLTPARADAPPYGIDLPSHRPTGRFSNGEQIGVEPLFPYLDPKLNGKKLLKGANFASAGIGILNDTGFQFRLHKLGARKVLVTATGPFGCAPAVMAMRSWKGKCPTDLKNAADLFNRQVTAMTQLLNKKLGSDVFISVDVDDIYMDFSSRPKYFGNSSSIYAWFLFLYFQKKMQELVKMATFL